MMKTNSNSYYKFLLSLGILALVMIACNPFRVVNNFKEETIKKVENEFGIDDDKRERLMKTGKSARGKVTKVEDTNVTLNKNPKVRLYVHVSPKDEEEFDAVVEKLVSRISVPRKGDVVTVWYDPNNRDDIIVE